MQGGSRKKQLLTVNPVNPLLLPDALLGNLNKYAWWFHYKTVLLRLTTNNIKHKNDNEETEIPYSRSYPQRRERS